MLIWVSTTYNITIAFIFRFSKYLCGRLVRTIVTLHLRKCWSTNSGIATCSTRFREQSPALRDCTRFVAISKRFNILLQKMALTVLWSTKYECIHLIFIFTCKSELEIKIIYQLSCLCTPVKQYFITYFNRILYYIYDVT